MTGIKNAERGSGLLELLLTLAVFASLMPFTYRFAQDIREKSENAEIVKKIELIKDALERHVADNRQKLLEPLSANVTRVKMSDLPELANMDLGGAKA
ncbi:MAG: hypothetical protein LBB08_01620, partial [Rickettsiales bacterium]|nr:hypothetical protein [Rickettsiales bacterium]